MKENILEVKGLVKYFGGLCAVNNFSFSLRKNSIIGLIGPNGAGKTTLFNLITGNLAPDFGEVWVKGENLVGKRPNEICHHGVCRTFQVAQPFREMTVLNNVMTGAFARNRHVDQVKARAIEIINFIGLEKVIDKKAGNLTTIDQRKLEFARALATDPDILLLDEAMAGLNPTECNIAINLIKKIRDENVSVIVVEHNMKAIMAVSDHIVVNVMGQNIAEGKPEEIVNNEKVIKAYLGEGYAC